MKLNIAVLEGDGIGPEVTREAVRVLRAVAGAFEHEFTFQNYAVGGAAIASHGTPLPDETIIGCLGADAVLLGAVGAPEFDSLPPSARPEAGLLALRKSLGAFANLRPSVMYDAICDSSPLRPELVRGADILIVRELLGGLYFGEPRGRVDENGTEVGINTMRYSVPEIERVAHVAFQSARARTGKVTSVDKANVLDTSQLWRETVNRIAQGYPDVSLEHLYVDACAMHLVTNPRRFDVILTENLFGDILSDEAAVLTGSLGTLASASIGGPVGLFEPVHGSAPDIAGRDLANPIGAIASAALLLRYAAGLEQEAVDVETAIKDTLDAGFRTADISRGGDRFGTAEVGQAIAERVVETASYRFAYHAV
jgi:3-isopropylmalate dehydrogenase